MKEGIKKKERDRERVRVRESWNLECPIPTLVFYSSSYLPRFGKSLCDLAVASAIAGRDEVSNATALQECGRGDGPSGTEYPGEGDHLH